MPYVEHSGVRIYYEVEGSGRPLVLQHGFASTLDVWREHGYTDALRDDHRLILIDARGCGRSDKPHEIAAYDYGELASDVTAVLDALEIDRSNYLGYSMGGRIGFRLALHAGERVMSFVLGGAAYPVVGTEDRDDEILDFMQATLETSLASDPDDPMPLYLATMEERHGPRSQKMVEQTLSNDARALLAAVCASRGADEPRAAEVLPSIANPVLMVTGSEDPRFGAAAECASLMPTASFLPIPGASHRDVLANPARWTSEVRGFLDESNRS